MTWDIHYDDMKQELYQDDVTLQLLPGRHDGENIPGRNIKAIWRESYTTEKWREQYEDVMLV
jgi:hypothetical protein